MRETDLPAVLLVDKPAGPTSHDVVQVARRAFGTRRIGHTGTLDPFASGLLILCVGSATRLVEYFHLLSKVYAATAVLGIETDTEDASGRITERSDVWRSLGPDEIEIAARGLVGEHDQVPPAFSARKVAGKRAYAAAREGEMLALEPRPVEVQSLVVEALHLPEVEFRARVSTGTYVRSLARDLGRTLGCGAHLKALRRLAIGPFDVRDAAAPTELEAMSFRPGAALAAESALAWLPRRILTDGELEHVTHGRAIPLADTGHGSLRDAAAPLPVVLMHEDRLVAIGRRESDVLKPEKVFAHA